MTQQESKGGLALPMGMKPMDEIVQGAFMPIMRELYGNVVKEQRAHKETLQVLAAVIIGQIALTDIVATDDGWQVKQERPASVDSPGGMDALAVPASNGAAAGAGIPAIGDLMEAS